MRRAILIVALATAATGFSPTAALRRKHALRATEPDSDSSSPQDPEVVPATQEPTAVLEKAFAAPVATERDQRLSQPGATDLGDSWELSRAVPFLPAPKYASFGMTMGADASFDPLGFADTPEKLNEYRDAELKHGRLAMLAAAGWPLSELWDSSIADKFGLPALLVDGKAPSLLNGGLEGVPLAYWAFLLGGTSVIEIIGLKKFETLKNPGSFAFDPLGLHGFFGGDKIEMDAREIRHGRLAMVAIVAFAFQEWTSGLAVVKETPFFFEPISQFMQQSENAGYISGM
jgi:hypothetical protein